MAGSVALGTDSSIKLFYGRNHRILPPPPVLCITVHWMLEGPPTLQSGLFSGPKGESGFSGQKAAGGRKAPFRLQLPVWSIALKIQGKHEILL